MPAITVLISDHMFDFLNQQRKKKGYLNVSEYFRTLLRQEQDREAIEKVEAALLKGLGSGADNKLTRRFWEELKVEAINLLGKHLPH